jgi:hypothetical protein
MGFFLLTSFGGIGGGFTPQHCIPFLCFWPIWAMTATIRATITTVYQVTLGHYTITLFHVKIPAFFYIIRKIIGVPKNIIEIAHEKQFLSKIGKLHIFRCKTG